MQRAFGLEIPQTLEEVCDPQRLALVVYDMQVGILSQISGGEQLVERVGTVLEAARAAGVRTVFLRHLSLPLELTGVAGLRTAMAWQRTERVEDVGLWFARNSAAFQLTPELAPRPSEGLFDKITMSAFESTPLNLVFRDCGINAFAIVGVATEVGIEPTVRHAIDLGYIPVIVADACAAGHQPAGERSLETLAFAGGSLQTDVATFSRLLGNAPGGE